MKKSIVFVYNNSNNGGAQKMILWVASMCVDKYDEVFFVSFHNSVENRISIPEGVVYKSLNIKKNIINRLFSTIIYKKKLVNILTRINPSLVCAFGYSAINICYKAKKMKYFALIGSERNSPTLLSIFKRLNSARIYKKCDAIVFQTTGARDYYGTYKNFYVIPNPFLGCVNNNPTPHEERKKVIFCASARFEYLKGFDVAIKAFNIIHIFFNDYKLIIYANGSNKYRKKCNHIIKKYNLLDFVEINETINNVAYVMKDSMVFMLPSRAEGIPNILLEVMGQGIPVVACDCPPGGPKLLTNNGDRGLLVPVNDYRSLAKCVINIINSPDLSNNISFAELKVSDDYSPNRVFKQWSDIFDELIANDKNNYMEEK